MRVIATGCLVVFCACGPSPESRPTELPDVSRMAVPVRQQLQAQFDRLAGVRADPTASAMQRAGAFGDMGKLLLAAEAFGDAEPYFVNARALAADDVRWTYYLAHVHRLKGESLRAAALFQETLQHEADDVPALVWLGTLYLDQGRPDAAEPLFARALGRAPGVAAAHLGLGRVALDRREFTRAIEHLERALTLERRATAVHYPLAMAYRAVGNLAQAESHLRQRGDVDIGPPDPLMQELADLLRSPVAHENRGERALAAGDFAGAVLQFRRGLELAPDSLSLRQKLAMARSLAGDVPGAVQELEEVLRRAPEFPEAHYSLGVLLLGAGQLDQAIERFATAVRGDPGYLAARLQLANALRQRGRLEPALGQYAQLIERDPRIAEARLGHAITLVRLKRYQEARRQLADAVKQFPNRPDFVNALARVHAAAPDSRVRDGQAARTLAQQLVSRGMTVEAGETMAMALAELGEFEEAIRWQRDAIAAATRAGLGGLATRMTRNLRLYERRQPCRTPWPEDPPS